METLHNKDLKVTIQRSSLIFSPQESVRKSMFLSNIDKQLNFGVALVMFFTANPNFPLNVVSERIENALKELLVTYDYLSGRIKQNSETDRFEFDCGNAGVGFVVANSECALDELIGDFDNPCLIYEQLMTKRMNATLHGDDDQPLYLVQLTSLKCGGFSIGMFINHTTFDALSFKYFLQNLAAVAQGKPLAVIPCHGRELLAARSPPHVTFEHPEFLRLTDLLMGQDGDEGKPISSRIFDNASEILDTKVFRLSREDFSNLKVQAKGSKATTFNVVSAHLWRCKALSCDEEIINNSFNSSSTLLYAVNIRSMLSPPLPKSFTGNAVLFARAKITRKEVKVASLGQLVDLMLEGASRMTDDYIRSFIDYFELYQVVPCGDLLVTSSMRLAFHDVEYPWGKPKYAFPMTYATQEVAVLFPSVDHESNGRMDVLVSLRPKTMAKFEAKFYELLRTPSVPKLLVDSTLKSKL